MIIKPRKKDEITAVGEIKTRAELERAIKDILTADICESIVDLAYSEEDMFTDDAFVDAETFWDVHANDDAKELVLKFFNGEDLDSRGPANPNRKYFRFDGYENIESTDYPGDTYKDELDIDIADYVLDHLDNREFPEEIQDLISNYHENREEE